MAIAKDYDPTDRGVAIFNYDRVTDQIGTKGQIFDRSREIFELIHAPKGSPFNQLQKWKKLGAWMLEYCQHQNRMVQMSQEQIARFGQESKGNNNKRWTDEEDELLVDWACKDDVSLLEMSTVFGRTPTAIKSRLTHLVGIRKLSQEIAGRFIGDLDGVRIEGNLKGTLLRQP